MVELDSCVFGRPAGQLVHNVEKIVFLVFLTSLAKDFPVLLEDVEQLLARKAAYHQPTC